MSLTTYGRDRLLQASQPSSFSGKVLSAAGAVVVGGDASNPGHPVVAATVYLVPTTAMDLSTKMTASAIYAAPYPAEAYDEPLEDAIRLKGSEFPQAMTDGQGNFRIEAVPDGNFFVHVTPAVDDREHLPGGDHSRNAYSVQQLSSEAMTIEVSSSPSTTAHAVGSTTCWRKAGRAGTPSRAWAVAVPPNSARARGIASRRRAAVV